MTGTVYDDTFFDENESGSYRSARVVLGLAIPLIKPTSVLDIGCGVGTWLRAAQEYGAREILGVDGDYVGQARLHVAPDSFLATDLVDPDALRRAVGGRRFDLTMCLEVAEHLPSAAAETFVEVLAETADLLLWSAAVPGQGGTRHVNERPLLYWASLWARAGFDVLDLLRPGLQMTGIDVWYAQNCVLLTRRGSNDHLRPRFENFYRERFGFVPPLGFVHPLTTARFLGRPRDEVVEILRVFAWDVGQHLAAELGVEPSRLQRLDFGEGGELNWVGWKRPVEPDGPEPCLLVMSPDSLNLTVGLYYPAWRASESEMAYAAARANAGGLMWDDSLGRQVPGWIEIANPDLRFRSAISLAEGHPEPTAAREAARGAARLWSAYFSP